MSPPLLTFLVTLGLAGGSAQLCSDNCQVTTAGGTLLVLTGDGKCSDGGPGSEGYDPDCAYGTDCTDCGPRNASDAPRPPSPAYPPGAHPWGEVIYHTTYASDDCSGAALNVFEYARKPDGCTSESLWNPNTNNANPNYGQNAVINGIGSGTFYVNCDTVRIKSYPYTSSQPPCVTAPGGSTPNFPLYGVTFGKDRCEDAQDGCRTDGPCARATINECRDYLRDIDCGDCIRTSDHPKIDFPGGGSPGSMRLSGLNGPATTLNGLICKPDTGRPESLGGCAARPPPPTPSPPPFDGTGWMIVSGFYEWSKGGVYERCYDADTGSSSSERAALTHRRR